MPMERDKHNELLNKLFDGELNEMEKTEILDQLRSDYGQVVEEFGSLTGERDKLIERNNHLVDVNGKLWRDGSSQNSPEDKQEDKQKEFSETITLEDIERQAIK